MLKKLIEWLARNHLDHPAHHIERDRIGPACPRLIDQGQRGQTIDKLFQTGHLIIAAKSCYRQLGDASGLQSSSVIGLLDRPLRNDRIAQPGGVGQQMANGDRRLGGADIRQRSVGNRQHLHLGKFGQNIAQRLI